LKQIEAAGMSALGQKRTLVDCPTAGEIPMVGKSFRLTLVLCLVAPFAAAQDVEQVTVYGGSLSGIWKVSRPQRVAVTMFHGTQWGPLQETFCRIDHDKDGYVTNCYGQGFSSGGTMEVNGRNFHLAWGTMMARMVLDGAVQSATGFTGHFAIKLAGISVTDPDQSEGTKLDIRFDGPDTGGKAQLVRDVLGGSTPSHDAALNDNLAAAQKLQLGSIEAISYLGQQSKAAGPTATLDPTYLTLYVVEFKKGERICALHQAPDGNLEAFQCF
jgi:hypothetical protein